MRERGFTLIEMTVAIVIGAILTGIIASFIATPMNAYFAQQRRSELNDSTESAVRSLTADIAGALPNSIRVTTIGARRIIEMIPVDDSSLYRDVASPGDQDLNVASFESQFDVLRPLNIGPISRVVIGNRTAAAQSAYQAVGRVITPVGMASSVAGPPFRVALNPTFQFGNASAQRRVYVVSTATQYHCDLTNRTLVQYRGLPIAAAITVPAAGGVIVARDVTACTFAFVAAPIPPATPSHGGIATLLITISRAVHGNTDQLRIAHEVAVRNPP